MADRREDLIQVIDRQSPRRLTIVDAIAGRIVRINAADWIRIAKRRQSGADENDRELVSQAIAASLMRHRASRISSSWRSPLSLLAFRIPLFNADRLAHALASRASFLFSPLAICGWCLLICVSALSLLIGWSQVQQSAQAVYAAANSATTLGYTLGGLFLLTKVSHELGHALACRRMGAPVGDCGVFFFCGVPCPYVDVTRIMQVDSKFARAAVMLAGVYVELVIAAIATAVWWSSHSGTVHLLASNLILVCGISTIVFNANPLMRMDGYFVLSDLLGTPNLRRQAALAWRTLVVYRLVGLASQASRFTWLRSLLGLYHLVASLYRWAIGLVILMFLFTLLREWNLWWMGIVMIGLAVASVLFQYTKGLISMLQGKGVWCGAPAWRRRGVGLAVLAIFGGLMMCPVRREMSAKGYVDAVDVINVYVPESSWVTSVAREFGEPVLASEPLVSLRDEGLAVQLVGMRMRSRLASLESAHLKRQSLQTGATDVDWQVDQANREWVESQYQSLVSRQERLQLVAPKSGVVLPPLRSHAGGDQPLKELEGRFVNGRAIWCRIGDPVHRCVCIPIAKEARQHLRVGDKATLMIDDGLMTTVNAVIDRIDEKTPSESQGDELHDDQHCFVARCRLPAAGKDLRQPLVGAIVEARIEFDREPLWKFVKRMVTQALVSS